MKIKKNHKKRITINIPQETYEGIEKARGYVSRSSYITQILISHLITLKGGLKN